MIASEPEDNRLSDEAYIASGSPISQSDAWVAGYNGETQSTEIHSSQEGLATFDSVDGREFYVRETDIVYIINPEEYTP